MPSLATLTMNPAIDISASVAHVEPTRKLRCGSAGRDPGGGGINVARVAGRLGANVTAVYPVGGLVGRLLNELLDAEGVASATVAVGGETREDLTIFDEQTLEQYRFVLPGPRLQDHEWLGCLETLAHLQHRPDFICASGSLPPGAPQDFYARVAEVARLNGARFVLDASGLALARALSERVHLCKPNLNELRELTGSTLEDETSQLDACRKALAFGRIEAIALTLGSKGALLVTQHEAWRAAALPIQPISTVGAGDSFLGAMVWALAAGERLEEAFRYGVAGGSAALLAPGTELCRPGDVRRLLPEVHIERVLEPVR